MRLKHPHPYLIPHLEGSFLSFAHRGGSSHLPENSFAAFSHAVDLGYRYLETDVHISRDGVLFAFHDSDLARTCGVEARISDLSADEIRDLRIDGLEPIPSLEELLSTFSTSNFNLDAKSDECVEPLIHFLLRREVLDRVCIGSFSHRRLRKIRTALGADCCTSASPLEVALWMLGRRVDGPSCIQVPLRQSAVRIVTRSRVERSEELGLPVHVWTIDDPTTMQELLDLGVHGIMTDKGDVLKRVAERNTLWH